MKDKWRDLASCRPGGGYSPQIFFPDTTAQLKVVQQICRECPVMLRCREEGRAERYGIWGGLLHKEKTPGPSPTREYLEEHGTPGGYSRHQRRGEIPCDRCETANSALKAHRRRTA